jgi:hypothetical protein
LPLQTLKNNLALGRKESGTERAAFAEAVDAARVAAAQAPMTLVEFRGFLNAAVRAGSVAAMKLWLEVYEHGEPDDELAALARRHEERRNGGSVIEALAERRWLQ